jgi:Protein of unknown function (DUF1822)
MINSLVNPSDTRLLMPEINWLEEEHFDKANAMLNQIYGEAEKWQAYLNALALLSLEQWFQEKTPTPKITSNHSEIATVGILKIGGFKIAAIATENLLDEVVQIPQNVIENPELVSHFYTILEVIEEDEQVILRGFIRYDKFIQYRDTHNLKPSQNNNYQIPLALLDTEPNHLLFYTSYIEPTAIYLPELSTQTKIQSVQLSVNQQVNQDIQISITNLSQWFQNIFDDTWQAMDLMLNPEANLVLQTRNIEANTKRGKLIDLGMQFGNKTVALLVSITEETEEKLGVLIQLYPTGGERFLPPDISLTLLSKAGKNLQEVYTRNQDNYIQLKPFRGEVGKKFSIQISVDGATICEDFEL